VDGSDAQCSPPRVFSHDGTVRAEIDSEHLFKEWPNLVGALAKKDLTAAQRALLPDGLFSGIFRESKRKAAA
jgi:hypothetical protein